ncbi:MAG: tetratricopeptide repeat protein [Synechococcales bacterium]|nr:tetratricopeptide repeat protein [Synechococcales bacterium]
MIAPSSTQDNRGLAQVPLGQAMLGFAPADAAQWVQQGLLADRQGDTQTAEEAFQRAIALNPLEVSAYNNLGCIFLRFARIEEAIALFQKALALQPQSAPLHNNLAQAWVEQGNWDAAFAAYEQALRSDPTFELAYYNLGRLWHHQQQYDRAIACFQRAIELNPDDIATLGDGAAALMDGGQFRRAFAYLRRAIALDPHIIDGYCQMVASISPRDELDRARQWVTQLVRSLQTTDDLALQCRLFAQTCFHYGNVAFRYGRYDQARDYYQRAIQAQPRWVELYQCLGDCLAKLEQINSAVMTYHTALMLCPTQPDIELRLAQLLTTAHPEQASIHYHNALAGAPTAALSAFQPTPSWAKGMPQRVYRTTCNWVEATSVQQVKYRAFDSASGWKQPQRFWRTPTGSSSPLTPKIGIFQPTCSGVSCQPCMARLSQRFQPTWISPQVFQVGQLQTEVPQPPQFVVSIPGGRAWIAPQQNSWMICDAIAIIAPDGALLGDVSRSYPWYLPGCDKHDPAQHRIFSMEELPEPLYIDGRVAVLSSLAGHVYYHWMFDVLPRFDILRQGDPACQTIDWFVVNSCDRPFQRETLEALGIPLDKVIMSDRHPHIQARELVVPSFPGEMDWVPPSTLAFLRQAFPGQGAADKLTQSTFQPAFVQSLSPLPKRIYVSRSKAAYRRVLNEDQLLKALTPLGFVSVSPESLSVREQAQLFHQAEAIVTPHGSALSNLAFCRPGTVVVELFAPNYVRTDYWILSHHLQLNHYYVLGQTFDCAPLRDLMTPTPLTENIYVSHEACAGILKVLTRMPGPS